MYSNASLNALSGEELVATPVLTPFTSELHAPATTLVTLENDIRNRILADGIPALSHAIGTSEVTGAINYNMPADCLPQGASSNCPQKHNKKIVWTHSTIREIAYYYVYPLFETIVNLTSLDKE